MDSSAGQVRFIAKKFRGIEGFEKLREVAESNAEVQRLIQSLRKGRVLEGKWGG